MLSLTRKTEYALIAICHLARSRAQVVSAREIATQHTVPVPLLMNVLKRLQQTGYVTSVRGARGGYLLARPPEDISLAGLIEVMEGPVKLVRCAPPQTVHGDLKCAMSHGCQLRAPVHRVHEQLVKFLSGVSVAELVGDDRRAELRAPQPVARVLAQ